VRNGENRTSLLVFILLIGAISGKFVGDILSSNIKAFSFLKTSYSIGTSAPFIIDLKVLSVTFGLNFNINIMSMLGIVLAIILFRKR
jgi:hypothetical protein